MQKSCKKSVKLRFEKNAEEQQENTKMQKREQLELALKKCGNCECNLLQKNRVALVRQRMEYIETRESKCNKKDTQCNTGNNQKKRELVT